MQSDTTNELSAALAKAQAASKAAAFDKVNPHFKNSYASLASVIDAIRKPFADNGLSYTQTTEIREGGLVLVTTLRHASGQWVASEYPLPALAKPQELGSALTYARRYSLSAIACIAADEDDDAEGARTSGQTASSPKPSAIKPKPVSAPDRPQLITAPDLQTWGQTFIAAIRTAKSESEVDEWVALNDKGLETLTDASTKASAHVQAAISEKRKTFMLEAAE